MTGMCAGAKLVAGVYGQSMVLGNPVADFYSYFFGYGQLGG